MRTGADPDEIMTSSRNLYTICGMMAVVQILFLVLSVIGFVNWPYAAGTTPTAQIFVCTSSKIWAAFIALDLGLENTLNRYRKTTVAVGLLFITATVTAILGYEVILSPILAAPDLLTNVAAKSTQVMLGVLLISINAIAVAAIAVLLFPIFRQHNETLAVGYVVSKIIEPVIFVVGIISLLSLVTISREFVQAGAADVVALQAVGTSLVIVHNVAYLLGGGIVLSLTALILNTILGQSKLVPRWLSVWGLIAALLMIASGLLQFSGVGLTSTIDALLMLPIAVQEMVFAVWLIVKGFNISTIESSTADSGPGRIDISGTMQPSTA